MWAGVSVRSLLMCLILAVVGCQSARYVTKQADGGVVAIPDNSDLWPTYNRKKAEELMKKHFPNGYFIEREEEVVTGSVTTNNESRDRDHFGPFTLQERTRNTTSTQNTTEWRITYRPK